MNLIPGKLYKIVSIKNKKDPIALWDAINAINIIDRLESKQIVMFIKYHQFNRKVDGLYAVVLYKDKIGLVVSNFLKEI